MLDRLIRNVTVIDGTGAKAFDSHVGISRDRIAGIWRGEPPPDAEITVDAPGKLLLPGFIDVHSHADLIHTIRDSSRRDLTRGRLAQGITTEIIGNCGLGACPLYGPARELLPDLNAWMTPAGCEWSWDSVSSYLDRIESARPDCNIGMLAPHGPLRIAAMGLAGGEPSSDQAASMRRMLEEALDAGAFGLSTGLIYPPGMYSSTTELVALARLAGRRGRLYASHVRGSSETLFDSVEELLTIGRDAEVPVHHSHNEAVGREHWWKVERVLEREERAADEGIQVSFDMFPYPAAFTMMLAIYPPWALEGGVDKLLERLKDHETRRRIRKDIETLAPEWPPWLDGRWPHNLVRAVGWGKIHVGSCTRIENKRYEFLSLEELGERMDRSPFDAISDLMIADGGMISQLIFDISGADDRESNLEMLLVHPLGILATDANDYGKGRPHPAAYGAFPRILARFVRDKHACTLEEAVRKMTGRPAELFGIESRGLVREGYFADLVLLDYDRLRDLATFEDPRTTPEGIDQVYVNGSLVLEQDRWVSPGAGQVLRQR